MDNGGRPFIDQAKAMKGRIRGGYLQILMLISWRANFLATDEKQVDQQQTLNKTLKLNAVSALQAFDCQTIYKRKQSWLAESALKTGLYWKIPDSAKFIFQK